MSSSSPELKVSTDDEKVPEPTVRSVHSVEDILSYRLYKRRFLGCFAMIVLNIVGGISWPWFGPISNNVHDEFGFTLDEVNWLGTIIAVVYLPVSLAMPSFIARYGIRRTCDVGAACLIISAWIRYAGTVRSLPVKGAYALVIIGQIFAAVAQPLFQILAPIYSETWFDLKGRTTATMLISIANPIGGAVGQLLSPLVGDTRQSILVLGIITTVAAPFVFLIQAAPPTPPTYAASRKDPSLLSLLRTLAGRDQDPHMSVRQRIDFVMVIWIFGVLVAATNAFAVASGQIFTPAGYSADLAGFFGACLLLSGIVAAGVTAPLFDRVFTRHLGLTVKLLIPILAAGWFSLIWAVKPNNTAGLFAIMALIGVTSVTLLPVGLELACDLTRNANASSSLLWFAGNLFCVVFLLSENALRAPETADPPLSFKRGLIFNGVFVLTAAAITFFLEGKQVRKELDVVKMNEASERSAQQAPTTAV